MAVVSIATLKTYFQTGDFPTETQFVDLIDTLGVGSTFESGTFTLSANGLTATGGTLINPGANPTLRITTTKKLKLWHGRTFETGNLNNNDDGRSDGIIQNSGGNTINCISVDDSGLPANGWTGLITAIADTSFDITFTQIGAGLAITGQMHLIE